MTIGGLKIHAEAAVTRILTMPGNKMLLEVLTSDCDIIQIKMEPHVWDDFVATVKAREP